MAIEKSGKWGLKPLDSSTPDGINLQLYISGHMCCVVGSLHGAAVIPKEHVFAYGPKTGPAFLRFFALWLWGGRGVGGCSNVLCLRYHRFSWVTTLHVMLHISVVHRWTHFMLHCIFPLYFGEHTSCYVAHFCCTSVTKLHVTLYTSVVLLWPNFMLHCTLLLYFSEHTACYIAHFCCTSVNTPTRMRVRSGENGEWTHEIGNMELHRHQRARMFGCIWVKRCIYGF